MQTPSDSRPTVASRTARIASRTLLAAAALGHGASAFAASSAGGDITRQADATGLWFVVLMLLFIATLIGGFWLHGRGDVAATPRVNAPTLPILPARR